jgi:uncharacterized membrane protein YeaQ/YmgE (transglycosylase-associated protein family)
MHEVWPSSFGGWIWLIVVGLVLGLIAKFILPGRQNIPIWLTIIAGIVGSLLGNAVAVWLKVDQTKGIDWIRHLFQVIGAVVIVGIVFPIWGSITGKSKSGQAPSR